MEMLRKYAFQIYLDSDRILNLHFRKTIYSHSLNYLSRYGFGIVYKNICKELSILDPFHLVNCLSGRAAPLKYPTSLITLFVLRNQN